MGLRVESGIVVRALNRSNEVVNAGIEIGKLVDYLLVGNFVLAVRGKFFNTVYTVFALFVG